MGAFDDLIPGGGGQPQAGAFDDLIPANPRAGSTAAPLRADPRLGQPEELSWMERLAAAFDKPGTGTAWLGDANIRGSAVGRFAKGASDPGMAIVQMAANALPDSTGAGAAVNQRLQEAETQYQQDRKTAGSEGADLLRGTGSAVVGALVPGGGAGVVKGALTGTVQSLMDPVVDGGGDFWSKKLEQGEMGAAAGAAMSPLLKGLSRLVSPKASVNPDLAVLRSEGVHPTIGQAAGGWANTVEEKAMSWPILGDMIARARRGAVEDFNNAAINRSLEPIGAKVKGAGQDAVAEAGDLLSAEYQRALGSVNHVSLATPTFVAKLGQLEQMAGGLTADMERRFQRAVTDIVERKVSPNGSILGADLKAIDSELGSLARKYGKSSAASEQELGDALKQLRSLITDEVRAARPDVAQALKAADTGWANLVRVEGASKAAANADGVFTPGQFNQSVRRNDSSVRGRATARGEALGQDLGTPAQNVLGNKYPDSGTVGRFLQGAGALAAGAIHPAIPAALVGGSIAYTKPVQNALVYLLSRRPDAAPRVANSLLRMQRGLTVGAVPALEEANR